MPEESALAGGVLGMECQDRRPRGRRGHSSMTAFRLKNLQGLVLALAAVWLTERASAQAPVETMRAFQRYSAAVQKRTEAEGSSPRLLQIVVLPDARKRLMAGEILTIPASGLKLDPQIDIPGGQVQHWIGAAFVPHASLDRAIAGLQDYGNRKRYMQPVIIDSRVLSHTGDEFEIYLRLRQKALLSAVFDVVQRIQYIRQGRSRLLIESKSESVREVPSEQSPRGTPARDRGLIWALDDYWRLAEGDGGVYIECEALVLSRQLPVVVRWFAGGMIARASERMLAGTLKADVRIIGDAQRGAAPQAERERGRNSGSVALLVSTQSP